MNSLKEEKRLLLLDRRVAKGLAFVPPLSGHLVIRQRDGSLLQCNNVIIPANSHKAGFFCIIKLPQGSPQKENTQFSFQARFVPSAPPYTVTKLASTQPAG